MIKLIYQFDNIAVLPQTNISVPCAKMCENIVDLLLSLFLNVLDIRNSWIDGHGVFREFGVTLNFRMNCCIDINFRGRKLSSLIL